MRVFDLRDRNAVEPADNADGEGGGRGTARGGNKE